MSFAKSQAGGQAALAALASERASSRQRREKTVRPLGGLTRSDLTRVDNAASSQAILARQKSAAEQSVRAPTLADQKGGHSVIV